MFNSISITLLIPIIYPPPMSILLLVNGPPVMYPSFFNYRNRSLSHDFGLLMNHLALSLFIFRYSMPNAAAGLKHLNLNVKGCLPFCDYDIFPFKD